MRKLQGYNFGYGYVEELPATKLSGFNSREGYSSITILRFVAGVQALSLCLSLRIIGQKFTGQVVAGKFESQ